MRLIKIPGEYVYKEKVVKKPKSILKKIRTRLATRKTENGKLTLKKACFSLMNFMSNEGHMNLSDLNNLIRHLERSIMVIQSSKKKLVEKEIRKK